MESIFLISKTDCVTCTNQVLKAIGTLQGVFGSEIDRIEGRIVVSHTDELTHGKIGNMLETLGFHEKEEKIADNLLTLTAKDEPSIWGCAL